MLLLIAAVLILFWGGGLFFREGGVLVFYSLVLFLLVLCKTPPGVYYKLKSIKKLRHVASELRVCKLQRAILNIPRPTD